MGFQKYLLLGILCFMSTLITLQAAFDKFENWGFVQDGGFRQENFIPSEKGLILNKMAWHAENQMLAAGGSEGNSWLVKVYQVQENGPVERRNWSGNNSQIKFNFGSVASIKWIEGGKRLICGVESVSEDETIVSLILLDPNSNEPSGILPINDFDSLIDLVVDPKNPAEVWILGVKSNNRKLSVFNTESSTVVTKPLPSQIINPSALVISETNSWIVGQANRGITVVDLFSDRRNFSSHILGPGFSVTSMVESGGKIYVSGCESVPGRKTEDFFLVCLEEQLGKIVHLWSVKAPVQQNAGREIGTTLVPTSDGGVLVGGYFRQPCFLTDGQKNLRERSRDAALLISSGQEQNFEGFLGRYDNEGNLLWAQTSGFVGNDFIVSGAKDTAEVAYILGNRKVDGGLGPYLSKVRLGGSATHNAPIVLLDNPENTLHPIIWESPDTLRFAEPLPASLFSARTLGTAEFTYRLNGVNIEPDRDIPLFRPGEMELSTTLFIDGKEKNTTSRETLVLKGRPYLKVSFEQVGNLDERLLNVQLFAELFGIHPQHKMDEQKLAELQNKISFRRVSSDEEDVIQDGILKIPKTFSGFIKILTTFAGDTHYESSSRQLDLRFIDGVVSQVIEGEMIKVQIKDLDGWQEEKMINQGSEVFVSATQGFGKNRKFNQWLEFSESAKKLQTARVQAPFNIRTSLIADEDMTLFAHYNFSFTGTAINGYLSGSTVFLDFNLNGVLDDGEPSALTDESGAFELDVTEETLQKYDRNGNGVLVADEAILVVTGGIDKASDLPFSITYKAPPGFSVVTSISTLVAEVATSGISTNQAKEQVAKFLGLPDDLEVSQFEPLKAASEQSGHAKTFLLKSTQLSNLLNEGSRYLSNTSSNQLSLTQVSQALVSTIGDQIISAQAGGNQKAINLANPEILKEIILETVEEVNGLSGDNYSHETQSTRSMLVQQFPDIANQGNDQFLDILVGQISSANTVLEELATDENLLATDFKRTASAVQVILEERGNTASELISDLEEQALSEIDSELSRSILSFTSSIDISFPENTGDFDNVYAIDDVLEFWGDQVNNLFAPVLANDRLVASKDLNQSRVVGQFDAVDPEGMEVVYQFSDPIPDLDGDGLPMLSVQKNNGEVMLEDFDDLLLSQTEVIDLQLKISDSSGLTSEQSVQIDLSAWMQRYGLPVIEKNRLTLNENNLIGSVVYDFSQNDSPEDNIVYQMLPNGDSNISDYFSLSKTGVLSAKIKFDFEERTQYSLRIHASNPRRQYAEKTISIFIEDVLAPIVETLPFEGLDDGFVKASGMVLDSSGSETWETGLLVSFDSPFYEPGAEGIFDIKQPKDAMEFGLEFFPGEDTKKVYAMAYASNEEGTHYGLLEEFNNDNRERFDDRDLGDVWTGAKHLDGGSLWWESWWFGTYFKGDNGWWYHDGLGWLYASGGHGGGLWMWKEGLGWVWTRELVYPFLYSYEKRSWYYFYGELNDERLLYDYTQKKWIYLNENGADWTGATRLEEGSDWWESWWLGTYFKGDNGWWYHESLGWLHASGSQESGLWMWKQGVGWLWTRELVYPFLYSYEKESWYYFNGDSNQRHLLYDYNQKKWLNLDGTELD